MTPKGQSQKNARMRREGYDRGYQLLQPQSLHAVYQQAWRRGWNARKDHDAHAGDTNDLREPEAS